MASVSDRGAEVGEVRTHTWIEVQGVTGFKSLRCEACDVFAYGGKTEAINPKCHGSTMVNVRLDADYGLKVGQVWPDGDYPDEITAEAVADVMKQQGRWELHHDWDLTPDYFVSFGMGAEVKVDV